jgi:capsular polysaccharide biosynthesis protein
MFNAQFIVPEAIWWRSVIDDEAPMRPEQDIDHLESSMELRLILKIILRRWWLVVVPPVLVGLITALTYQAPAPSYAATLRFAVGYPPEANLTSLYDRKYPAWLASEYISGGLSDWAKTGDFAQAVADDAGAGAGVTAAEVAGSITSDHLRSIVVLYLNGGDAAKLTAIGTAAIKVLQTRNSQVFPQNGDGATVTALDSVSIGAAPPSLRNRLDIPIRLTLGLAFGVVLAFVAHYFDPRFRERSEVEAIGFNILGEIPK